MEKPGVARKNTENVVLWQEVENIKNGKKLSNCLF